MTTPAWLQAMALLAWAATLGQGLPGMALGAVLAGLRLLAEQAGLRVQFDERGLNRSVDASALVVTGSLAALLAAQGLPNGLLTAMGWLPVTLLPLLLIACCNETPLRLRHLALSLRGSTRPEAALPVDPQAPYLAITLLASAVLARSSAWAFWLLSGILLAWLFVTRPPPRRRDWALFATSAALALGLAFITSQGLQRAQLALQDWVADRLAGVDSDPYQSQTRIGDLGRVKLSERIVWRLRQTPPVEVPLLLRTSVFTHYANGTWLARRDAFSAAPDSPTGTAPRLMLHGDSQQGSALLPVPAGVGAISAAGRLERNALGVVRLSEAPALLQIGIGIGIGGPALAPPSAGDLALPPGFAAVLDQLPELAALRSASPQQQLAGLTAWFGEHFRYTLFIGDEASGRRDLQRFLLSERAGHCEYFASATVLLLRALGIPARYVTGYSVQEYSRLEQAFVVRSRHAHAWTEAFVDGRWIEIDTTPATWLGIEEDAAPWWRPAADLGSFIWRRLGELRREAFAGDHSAAGWGSTALLLLLWFGRRHWRGAIRAPRKVGAGDTASAPPSAEVQAFHVLEQQCAELGLGRHASEAPRTWLARLAIEGRSVIDVARLVRAQQVVEALYRQRYAQVPTDDENPLQSRA